MLQVVEPMDIRVNVGEAEWQARVELAALYRTVDRYGLTELIYNHITLRVPDHPDQFLINPFGLAYSEITASSLMKIDRAGEILLQPDHGLGINYTGFVIHGAIHEARPDVNCVVHTHTRAGVAVSALTCGILPLSQSAMRFHDAIGYHEFEGFAFDLSERERLARDLGDHENMVLRNHGLLSCGPTIAQTFINVHQLEMVCREQIDVLATGAEINPVSAAAIAASKEMLARIRASGKEGQLEWAAQRRWLDRHAPDYRD